MDIQGIIEAVSKKLSSAPDSVQDFVSNPSATIENITGEKLDTQGISDVVSGVVARLNEGGGDVAAQLSKLTEGSPLESIVSGLGSSLNGDSIGAAADAVGSVIDGIFGKKK